MKPGRDVSMCISYGTDLQHTNSMPKTDVIKQVRLKDHLRPTMSTRIPHPSAPILYRIGK